MNFLIFLIVFIICDTLITITKDICRSIESKYKFEKDLEREVKEDE